MNIVLEASEYPTIVEGAVLDLIDQAVGDPEKIRQARRAELSLILGFLSSLGGRGPVPLRRLQISCPRITRICAWGSYQYGTWEERDLNAVLAEGHWPGISDETRIDMLVGKLSERVSAEYTTLTFEMPVKE